jgi:hypothetical protein
VQLLVIDDFGLTPLIDSHQRDLLELLDDRYDKAATLVTSQLPVDQWHGHLGDPTRHSRCARAAQPTHRKPAPTSRSSQRKTVDEHPRINDVQPARHPRPACAGIGERLEMESVTGLRGMRSVEFIEQQHDRWRGGKP